MRLPRPPLKLHVGKGSTVSEKARQEHERIAEQYGFPSTHSAHALLLGTIFGRALLSPGLGRQAFVLVHTAHVALSRLYMGVHSLADVLGGLLVGALLAFGAFEPLGLFSDATVSLASTGGTGGGAGVGPLALYASALLALLAVFPDKRGSTFEETVSFAGVHLGLVIACALARDDAPRAAFVASLRAPGGSTPAMLAATVMPQLITGLTQGTPYYVHVMAYNGQGYSERAAAGGGGGAVVGTAPIRVPGRPTSVALAPASSTQLRACGGGSSVAAHECSSKGRIAFGFKYR